MNKPLIVVLLGFAAACAACSPAATQQSATTAGTSTLLGGDKTNGSRIFALNCSTCHGTTGLEGGVVGPSLRHESQRMDFAATVSWIEDPQPPMPALYPQFLTEAQVRDVAAYVESL